MQAPKRPLTRKQQQELDRVLAPFREQYPDARVAMYRRNQHAIRIRVVDSAFERLDRSVRKKLLWTYLDQLPPDVLQDITMLLVLTPTEVEESYVNDDFEHPLPSPVF